MQAKAGDAWNHFRALAELWGWELQLCAFGYIWSENISEKYLTGVFQICLVPGWYPGFFRILGNGFRKSALKNKSENIRD